MPLLQGQLLSAAKPLFSLSSARQGPPGRGIGVFSLLAIQRYGFLLPVNRHPASLPGRQPAGGGVAVFPHFRGPSQPGHETSVCQPGGTKGWFVKPATALSHRLWMTFLERINRDTSRSRPYHQSHIGESLSLIYAPFYVGKTESWTRSSIEPVSQQPGRIVRGLNQFHGGPADWKHWLHYPTLCPNCGWDMEGQPRCSGPAL